MKQCVVLSGMRSACFLFQACALCPPSLLFVSVNRIYTAETATRNITDEELFWLFLILFLLRGNTMSSIFRYFYKLLTLDYYFLFDRKDMFWCTFYWRIIICMGYLSVSYTNYYLWYYSLWNFFLICVAKSLVMKG